MSGKQCNSDFLSWQILESAWENKEILVCEFTFSSTCQGNDIEFISNKECTYDHLNLLFASNFLLVNADIFQTSYAIPSVTKKLCRYE